MAPVTTLTSTVTTSRRIACLLLEGSTASPGILPGILMDAPPELLDIALDHSPRVEDGGADRVFLDASGLRGLFGDEAVLGARLRARAAARGLAVRVGLAGSRIAARVAALRGTGVAVIPPGEDAAWLAPAPLALLDGAPEVGERLARWGVRTFGELAALPSPDVFERLGGEGLRLQALARGEDPRPLALWRPPLIFEAARELDWAEATTEPVAALFAELLAAVCARLERAGLAADLVEWECRLEDGRVHAGRFAPPFPTREPGGVLPVLRAWLEAEPPAAAVTAVALRAHPLRVAAGQDSLLARARPSPRALTEAVARVTALMGPDRVGTPVLEDSHRPDAVHLVPVSPRPARAGSGPPAARTNGGLALRRLRPPRPAAVRVVAGRPVALRAERVASAIVASAGPWRASGEWWSERPWARDEWDVELTDGTLCRLAHDGSAWFLDGVYD